MSELVHPRQGGAIVYPESDGQPLAETGIHGDWIVDVRHRLRRRYADQPNVHVGMNLLLYWVEGDPSKSLSPDVFITFGIDKVPRRTYLVWVEGKAPDVVFEITSPSTRRRDLGVKKRIYESLGVREYFLYDPLGEYLDPPLMGFRLSLGRGQDARYVRLEGPPLVSAMLDLSLELDPEGALVMRDRRTGDPLLSDEEWAEMLREQLEHEARRAEHEAQRAEHEAQRAEHEAQRAEHEAQRAEREAKRAERAEARQRELEALLTGRRDE